MKNFSFKLKLIAVFVISICFTLPVRKDDAGQLKADQIAKKEGKWHYFKNGTKVSIDELIEKNFEIFGLPKEIRSRIEKKDVDKSGNTHYLLKLEINGIPIDDGFYTAHYSKNGELLHTVGRYDKNRIPKEKVMPAISRKDAFEISVDALLKSKHITSQSDRAAINSVLTKQFEKGVIDPQLVYYSANKKNNLSVVYRVDIFLESLLGTRTCYIDAVSGKIVNIKDNKEYSYGVVDTKYNGQREFTTKWRGWPYSYHYLRTDNTPTTFETRNSSTQYNYQYDNDHSICIPWAYENLDRVHKDVSTWPEDYQYNAASSHWALSETYRVFRDVFGRTYGTFNNYGPVGEIYVENINTGTDYDGLYKGPGYGYSTTNDYINVGYAFGEEGFEGSLDVIAHEFTHGVIYRARGVTGATGETGALCESFGDIFGAVVEYYSLGSTDYVEGSNLLYFFRRAFQYPTDYQRYIPETRNYSDCYTQSLAFTGDPEDYPTYYYGPDWDPNGDRYINCSVQNHWFYLLAEGGTQLGVTVNGIGIAKASQITCSNMEYYLTMNSDFDDMRQASIENASDLYGECSNEYKQVMNAWAAVNVGTPAPDPCTLTLHATAYGPTITGCGNTEYYSSYVTGGTGNYTYEWSLDNEIISYSPYFYYTFPEYMSGTAYFTLAVTDGYQNAYSDRTTTVWCGGYMKSAPTDSLLFVYPNPASDYVKLQLNTEASKNDKEYIVNVHDKYGKLIYSSKTKENEIQINVSPFLPGNYFITVIHEGKKKSSVFIKK